jgi:hypothetical protein
MDPEPVTTYKETTPSVEDSANENQPPNKSNKKRKRQNDEITNPFFKPFAVTVCVRDSRVPPLSY